MSYSHVRILTEGGGAKGLGHVYRSITLAQLLPGARILIEQDVGHLIHDSGVDVGDVSEAQYARVLIRDLSPEALGGIVRSTYNAFTVDICDDLYEASGDADLTIATFGADDAHAHIHGPNTSAGLRYAVLRPEFSEVSTAHSLRRNVVICLGGVDPSEATARLGAAIDDRLPQGMSVRMLTGPGSSHGASGLPVWKEMLDASVAIVSPGATLLECAAVGVPALVVAHNDREHTRALRMQEAGCGWFEYVGMASVVAKDAEFVRRRVLELVADGRKRERMRADGRRLVDGCGAWRVAGEIRRALYHSGALPSPPAGAAGERAKIGGARP